MIKFIAHAISHFQQCSGSLPLSFSVSQLSCSLPTTFDSVYKPCCALSPYQLINVFREELLSFQRLDLHKNDIKGKVFLLSVIMFNVKLLNFVIIRVILLNIIMLKCCLSVILLITIPINATRRNVFLLSVILINVILPNFVHFAEYRD
jgi:hypothetical protein